MNTKKRLTFTPSPVPVIGGDIVRWANTVINAMFVELERKQRQGFRFDGYGAVTAKGKSED
jgi:plastocyanin